MTSALKSHYEEHGYVIIPDLIEDKDWPELEQACERVIAKTREGSWPHRRTVGKQFPPYGQDDPDSWGVQHVMHPDLHEPAFVRWYTSPKLLGVAKELLGCNEDDLQMGKKSTVIIFRNFNFDSLELFNLLINPVSHDFALRWHRDDIPEDATPQEELQALKVWHFGVSRMVTLLTDINAEVGPFFLRRSNGIRTS